jgi:prepilin-type N-terminal cleavage/methylation domain-containing protein
MMNRKNLAQSRLDQKKKGFTLTEIAIVLGIIGLILGAIWVAAAGVYQNQRNTHANTQVMQLVQSIRTLYATSASDTGLTTASLITAGAVPTDMVNGATLSDPYSGATTIQVTTDGLGFYISMSNLTQAQCANLLMAIASANRDPSLFLASAPALVPPAVIGTPITITTTPALAIAATANNFGGCTAVTGNVVNFGFGLH